MENACEIRWIASWHFLTSDHLCYRKYERQCSHKRTPRIVPNHFGIYSGDAPVKNSEPDMPPPEFKATQLAARRSIAELFPPARLQGLLTTCDADLLASSCARGPDASQKLDGKCLPESERENFNYALCALAFFSRRQDRELPGAISRGLLDCPCRG
jgi:hypothetical protein